MISFDFEYYRPSTLDEAVNTFAELDAQGKKPVYYSGGTEIITMARLNQMYTGAVVDIKEIPECGVLKLDNDMLISGSAVTLSNIRESNLFPLLSDVIRTASDHTTRNKITLGGNICSAIPYRETALPFLLCDSEIVTAGPGGLKCRKFTDVFDEIIKLEKGELIVQIKTPGRYMSLPFEFIRKTRQDYVDYPMLSIASVIDKNLVKIAFSGLCAFPFRSLKIEKELENFSTDPEAAIDKVVENIPAPILEDIRGSARYREFVFRKTMSDLINRIGGLE